MMTTKTLHSHLVQLITVTPDLRANYLLGPAAYRAAHAALRTVASMWEHTTPCHVRTASTSTPVEVASC